MRLSERVRGAGLGMAVLAIAAASVGVLVAQQRGDVNGSVVKLPAPVRPHPTDPGAGRRSAPVAVGVAMGVPDPVTEGN